MPLSHDDYDKVQVAAWSECVQLYCGAPMNTMIAATSVFALYFSNLPHTLPRWWLEVIQSTVYLCYSVWHSETVSIYTQHKVCVMHILR